MKQEENGAIGCFVLKTRKMLVKQGRIRMDYFGVLQVCTLPLSLQQSDWSCSYIFSPFVM